jgi:hypothetical protein
MLGLGFISPYSDAKNLKQGNNLAYQLLKGSRDASPSGRNNTTGEPHHGTR